MIGRVRDRATFDAFRRQGRRARLGPITVVFVSATKLPASGERQPRDASPELRQVAFSVGRKVGHAVVRNRLRRQLREIMRQMCCDDRPLPAGAYLVIVHPRAVHLSFAELRQTVTSACCEVVP